MNLGFVFVIIGFACVALIQNNEASRILCVFPSPSKSHLLIHLAIAEALADAGHEVTVVATTSNNTTKSPQNHQHHQHNKFQLIPIDGPTFGSAFAEQMVNRPLPWYQRVNHILQQIFDLANTTMNHPQMLDFLQSHKSGDFDVLLLGYFMNDFMLGLGAHFQCPIILSFMIQPIFPINRLLGNPPENSYVPTLYLGLRQPMNFWARVKNQLSSLFEQQVLATLMEWKTKSLYRDQLVLLILENAEHISVALFPFHSLYPALFIFRIPSIEMARSIYIILGILSLSATLCPANAARILGYFPSPSKSHLLIHSAVAETLAAAGHNVTVIASFPNLLKRAKYNYINLEGSSIDPAIATEMVNKPQPVYMKINLMLQVIFDNSNATLRSRKMQEFLKTHEAGDFDLLIVGYFVNDFILGLGAHFQCPVVLSFMVQPILPVNIIIGNPMEIAYVPSLMMDIRPPMTFLTRVKNYIAMGFERGIMSNLLKWRNKQFYRYNFPADRYPPLEEVYKNVSLVLTNHHFSQGPIRPNVPALIEIGGIQIKETPDALPQDLAQIMDSAKNGVIFFSLGTNVQGSNLSKEKAKIIFNVLSKLPYTILLKWGDSDFPGQSSNIIYKSWLPQDDVLAHPKVKLFITHGGQGSVVESQYHGVPMVGIPFFGDQHSNMANVKKSGFGLTLDYSSLTEEDMRSTILEVLNNPLYRNNVQTFSKLYRDRPMTPRQLVRYWVDYVIRHNGAKHLQSPAVFMNWWQLNSVDVIAFLLAIVCGVVGILVGLCKYLCCRGKKAVKKPVTTSKKNK